MSINDAIKEHHEAVCRMISEKTVDESEGEYRMDEMVPSVAQRVSRQSMAEASRNGRSGWWDEGVCSLDDLRSLASDQLKSYLASVEAEGAEVDRKSLVDLINYAAVLYVRETVKSGKV